MTLSVELIPLTGRQRIIILLLPVGFTLVSAYSLNLSPTQYGGLIWMWRDQESQKIKDQIHAYTEKLAGRTVETEKEKGDIFVIFNIGSLFTCPKAVDDPSESESVSGPNNIPMEVAPGAVVTCPKAVDDPSSCVVVAQSPTTPRQSPTTPRQSPTTPPRQSLTTPHRQSPTTPPRACQLPGRHESLAESDNAQAEDDNYSQASTAPRQA